VEHEGDVTQIEREQERLKVGNVVAQPVRVRRVRRLRFSHAHVIGDDAPPAARERGDEVAVETPPRRVAMEQHNGFTTSLSAKWIRTPLTTR
jgi:hypothetical protein